MSGKKQKKQAQPSPTPPGPPRASRLLLALAFVSGFAGLVYQVLWMKQLGLLFGNTAHAASATLASFFAGLAAGSWFWGQRATRSPNPLRTYAWLEGGIAVTALFYFAILALFSVVYPLAYRAASGPAMLLTIKFVLSLLLIFPPSFCMGGTLPVMGQYLVRDPSLFGKTSALLYGINTLGAALGAGAAAFLLVPWVGFNLTCAVAILLSVAVGAVAWRLSANAAQPEAPVSPKEGKEAPLSEQRDADAGPSVAWTSAVTGICFLSGFAVLALEVLWTRMFAQIHSNSVYAFAVILVVILTCLAAGAWLSSRLARWALPPLLTLGILTAAGGATLAFGPALFMRVTNDLEVLSSLEPWPQYISRVFRMGFGGIGLVVFVLGTIFPFLMKVEERRPAGPGRILGRLLAINTAGAIVGALVCGFVFLPLYGMWRTMRLITACYLVAGLLLPYGWRLPAIACRVTCGIFLLLVFTVLDPADLRTDGYDPRRSPEVVLETWEGSDCSVAVVEKQGGNRAIRMNSGYTLGGTEAFIPQLNQAQIPLYIYPDTESIFFLGLGTGISAGAALDPEFRQVKRIVSCELIPEVVAAAKKYMPPQLTGGVFTDPRSTILIEDGRHYLMATEESYDMINADLFLPYRRGAGSLYSLDHYRKAKERLAPGGVFVQWLPLFQLTEREFGIIARTMLEAFGQVTMWRNNFQPGKEIVALIGQEKQEPIPALSPESEAITLPVIGDASSIDMQNGPPMRLSPKTAPFLYCGNLTKAKHLFEEYPVNTDNRPLIEYLAPRLFRENADQTVIWFVGPKIATLTAQLLEACPPDTDPVLQGRSRNNKRLALAGAAFHRSLLWDILGDPEAARREWRAFTQEWNKSARSETP